MANKKINREKIGRAPTYLQYIITCKLQHDALVSCFIFSFSFSNEIIHSYVEHHATLFKALYYRSVVLNCERFGSLCEKLLILGRVIFYGTNCREKFFFLCHDLRIRLVHFSVSAMNDL